MPGPDRTPASKRLRRNRYVGEKTLPAEGPETPARELPSSRGDEMAIWTLEIQGWWRAIWTSPMAWAWDPETDYMPLVRLATLNQNALLFGDTRCAAEARQLEDRFGLTPKSRNSLGWSIAEPESDADETAAAPAADGTRPPREDPRALRRVK